MPRLCWCPVSYAAQGELSAPGPNSAPCSGLRAPCPLPPQGGSVVRVLALADPAGPPPPWGRPLRRCLARRQHCEEKTGALRLPFGPGGTRPSSEAAAVVLTGPPDRSCFTWRPRASDSAASLLFAKVRRSCWSSHNARWCTQVPCLPACLPALKSVTKMCQGRTISALKNVPGEKKCARGEKNVPGEKVRQRRHCCGQLQSSRMQWSAAVVPSEEAMFFFRFHSFFLLASPLEASAMPLRTAQRLRLLQHP